MSPNGLWFWSNRSQLNAIQKSLDQLNQQLGKLKMTLDQVLDDVRAERTKIDSLVVLLNNIHQELKDILAGGLTPDQQAKVDAIFTEIEDNKAAVQAAIDTNSVP